MPESVAVNVRNRSHALIVESCTIAGAGEADGVLLALGSALGGWSLHILDGRLRYVHNLYGKERHVVESAEPGPPGEHRVEYAFTKDERPRRHRRAALRRARDRPRADPAFHPVRLQRRRRGIDLRLRVGAGRSARATRRRSPFGGEIRRAVVARTGPVVRDPLAELEAILSQQ